jgi:hypothetical protein
MFCWMGLRGGHIGVLAAGVTVAVLAGVVGRVPVDAGQGDVSPVVGQGGVVGPAGSERFGQTVVVLANGNYVVTDPLWNDGGTVDVGAVYLYDGVSNTAIATLTGSSVDDKVGVGGVTVLSNGNYVVASPEWDSPADIDAGAATWVNGATGVSGPVTTSNSLYGTTPSDGVSVGGVTVLSNGNYVVASGFWDSPADIDAGAATWGNGATGVSGPVTTNNSLYGTTPSDRVSDGVGVRALSNGNYVVASFRWDSPADVDAGAATWGNGATGITGPVTTSNSLYGTTPDDVVSSGGVTALSNGNYVVASPSWDSPNSAGAGTWGNGTTGITGPVTTSNSLYGPTPSDLVSSGGVTALSNGNYVVSSPFWDSPTNTSAGAATWGNGTTGITGPVTTSNSLYGPSPSDVVSFGGVTALSNGNYVVASPSWDSPTNDVGAATWGNGTTGVSGPVATSNSLYGTTPSDKVSDGRVTALSNGNYVVASPEWDSPTNTDAGAATWGNGTTVSAGPVMPRNSLFGTTASDLVSSGGVRGIVDGDFVVTSSKWDSGGVVNAGAVTLRLGDAGSGGAVSASNSVVGTPPGGVGSPSGLLTSGDAIPVPTSQDRVLLMLLDRSPFFPTTPPDVNVEAAPGAKSATVTFPLPVAEDVRSTPTVVCVPASGSMFAVGTTGVLCTATDSVGLTATTGFNVNVTATDYVSVTPARLLDTRSAQATIDNKFNGDGPRPAGSTLRLTVGGRGGIPTDAKAVAFNVTATNTVARGFVTAFPCDQPRPNASNLNNRPGVVVPNLVISDLDNNGEVCLYTHTQTDLIVDIAGYFPTTTTFETINPARLLDTRPGQPTIDGQNSGAGPTGVGQVTTLQISGRATIPNNATAAALNLTLTGTTGQMFATIYPCDTTRPEASNINATAGATIANSVIAKLAGDGTICIYTHKSTDLIVDVAGWFTNQSNYTPLTPARLLDTRPGQTTIDGQNSGIGLRPAGTTTTLQINNRGGAPNTVATVVINVTVTQTVTPGFVTVYPCDKPRPNASNLNYRINTTVANNVIVKTSPTGTICFYNHTPTQLIADINGYLPT